MPDPGSLPSWTIRNRAQSVVLGLVTVLLGIGALALLAQRQVEDANSRVTERWMPALVALERTQSAYVDQQTAVRGYVLTGQQQFMTPYRNAQEALPGIVAQLRGALADDPEALRQLATVTTTHDDWLTQGVAPQLARIDAGRLAEAQQVALAATGPSRFDAVRGAVAALRTTVQAAAEAASAEVTRVRQDTQVLLLVAMSIGVLLAVALLVGLRRAAIWPLRRLVDAVTAVADGRLDRPVEVNGPREIARVAGAVERMRNTLRQHAADQATSAEREARLQESERIAVRLQDGAVNELFATSVALLSLTSRSPEVAGPIHAAVRQLDEIAQQLRSVALDLSAPARPQVDARTAIMEAVEDVHAESGLDVDVRFTGSIDTRLPPELVGEVASALRATLTDLAHQGIASVVLDAALPGDSDAVQISVSFGGPSGRGAEPLRDLAERFGGTFAESRQPGGRTLLRWTGPSR